MDDAIHTTAVNDNSWEAALVAKARGQTLTEGGDESGGGGRSARLRAGYSLRHTRPHAKRSKICIEFQRWMVVSSSCLPAESFEGVLYQERTLRTIVTCTKYVCTTILLHKIKHCFALQSSFVMRVLYKCCAVHVYAADIRECWYRFLSLQ